MPAGHMYGTDIYGEAVLQGRENAALAGAQIYFVNRDFFDFTSDYLFDEIIGEFPRFSPGERAKAEDFYRKFFCRRERDSKAWRTHVSSVRGGGGDQETPAA